MADFITTPAQPPQVVAGNSGNPHIRLKDFGVRTVLNQAGHVEDVLFAGVFIHDGNENIEVLSSGYFRCVVKTQGADPVNVDVEVPSRAANRSTRNVVGYRTQNSIATADGDAGPFPSRWIWLWTGTQGIQLGGTNVTERYYPFTHYPRSGDSRFLVRNDVFAIRLEVDADVDDTVGVAALIGRRPYPGDAALHPDRFQWAQLQFFEGDPAQGGTSVTLATIGDLTRPNPIESVPEKPDPPELTPGDGRLIVRWTRPLSNRPILDYDVGYRIKGVDNWTDWPVTLTNTVIITGLANGTTYEVRIRASNAAGAGEWSDPSEGIPTDAAPPIPPPSGGGSDRTTITLPDGFTLAALEGDLLRYQVRFGRSEAAFRATAQPLQGQLILDNADGAYDRLLPNSKITQNITVAGESYKQWAGWVSDVQPSTDHATGLRTAVVRIQGALQQLARQDYELALFLTDTVRTGEIVNAVLDRVGRDDIGRMVDPGQVRLHPAHYASVLTPRKLHNALAVLRATEEAEVGLIHEGRGDFVHFEDRFHREVQRDVIATYTFGATGNAIQPEGVVEPDLNYDNIYNVVQAGAERAVVQAAGRVYTLGGKGRSVNAQVPANTTFTLVCDLVNDVASRENEYVTSVESWQESAHVLEPNTLTATYEYTRTQARVTITNPTGAAITLTKLELHGVPVALYGDLTLPPQEDAAAISRYGRRSLRLPTSFIGDGINHDGDAIAAGRAYADMLLARYSAPVITGRLQFNPHQHEIAEQAAATLQVGDPVTVAAGTGLPVGVYHVEGMEFSGNGRDGANADRVVATVSRRGRSRTVINNPVTASVGRDWTEVGSRALVAGEIYIIGLDAGFADGVTPATDDDALVARVVVGGEVKIAWAEMDWPVGDDIFLGVLVKAGENVAASVQVRQAAGTGNTLTPVRWRVIRTEV